MTQTDGTGRTFCIELVCISGKSTRGELSHTSISCAASLRQVDNDSTYFSLVVTDRKRTRRGFASHRAIRTPHPTPRHPTQSPRFLRIVPIPRSEHRPSLNPRCTDLFVNSSLNPSNFRYVIVTLYRRIVSLLPSARCQSYWPRKLFAPARCSKSLGNGRRSQCKFIDVMR